MKLVWIFLFLFCGSIGVVNSYDRGDQNAYLNFVMSYSRTYKYNLESGIIRYLFSFTNRFRGSYGYMTNYIQSVAKYYAPSLVNDTEVQDFVQSSFKVYEKGVNSLLPVFLMFYNNLNYVDTYIKYVSSARYNNFNNVRIKYRQNLDTCIYANYYNFFVAIYNAFFTMHNCYQIYAGSSSSLSSTLSPLIDKLDTDAYNYAMNIYRCGNADSDATKKCVKALLKSPPDFATQFDQMYNITSNYKLTDFEKCAKDNIEGQAQTSIKAALDSYSVCLQS